MSNVLDRLTDPSAYTGTHKHRFDKDGKGRGKAGRDVGGKGKGALPSHAQSNKGGDGRIQDLSEITRPNLDDSKKRSPRPKKIVHKAVMDDDGSYHVAEPKKGKKKGGGSSIFDRLTDPAGYTGAHKNRFDSHGRGRGKAGREQDDIGTKGLNELTRTNMNKGRSHFSS